MIRRACLRLALAAGLALGASRASAQVFTDEVPVYHLAGSALVSYLGSWQDVGGHLVPTHQLAEGASLSLSGWLYESRFVKFRTYALVLHLDDYGANRGRAYSIGYGGSLRLLSGSILPLTVAYGHGLAVTGSTLQAAGVTSTTSYQGFAQLVSPVLPRLDVRVQRLQADDASGRRSTSDSVAASAYGASGLHRYAAVASWQGQQVGAQPRSTTTMASVSDDAFLSASTRASFSGSLSRSTGLGGNPDDAFTSYSATGALLTRLSPRALLRGQYGYATDTAPDREQASNQASLGSTVDLKPLPLLLGEGLAANETRFVAPGLDRTVDAVSASQGIAARGRWGATTGSLAATGQAGYSAVSDGTNGSLLGYGLNGALTLAAPRAPVHASAFFADRVDHSSAGSSLRTWGALTSSDVARWYPLYLVPSLSYTHLEQRAFFAEAPGSDALAPPMSFTESDTITASLSGVTPLYGTRLSFAGGWVDASSSSASTHVRQVFGRAADAFRLAPGTFGNLTVNASHELGAGTSLTSLASVVWSFRESSLSATYSYALALPAGTSAHTVALLFTRTFDTTFLPESR